MPVRSLPAALAALGLAALTLAGCSAQGSSGCTPTASAQTSALELITVTGDTDEEPEVDVRTPFYVTSTQHTELARGEGTPITSDDQLVVLDISLTDGTTGEQIAASAYDGDLSRVFSMANLIESLPGVGEALQCAATGSRVLIAMAPEGIGEQTASGFGLSDEDSVVAVIDVRKVYLGKADGALQYNARTGMPSVVRAPDGRPGLIVPDGAPPAELAVQVLKRGTGEAVTADEPVRLHYTGVLWDDKSVFDSTWDGEPQSLTLDATVAGFRDALEGQTVGSQILVVVPPDQGYGDEQQGSVPPDSTLVFVVDILGIDAVPAEEDGAR